MLLDVLDFSLHCLKLIEELEERGDRRREEKKEERGGEAEERRRRAKSVLSEGLQSVESK